jgi:peptidylprolyl isomerase domain and WD repeat-containing protein 1
MLSGGRVESTSTSTKDNSSDTLPTVHHFCLHLIMSENEAQAVSGTKRPREEDAVAGETNGTAALLEGVPEMPSADLDDSDDEIGPMPDAPSVEVSKGRKKKRAVLSHERVYLENIPDTDRYTKSFMHRADINFVTMTK